MSQVHVNPTLPITGFVIEVQEPELALFPSNLAYVWTRWCIAWKLEPVVKRSCSVVLVSPRSLCGSDSHLRGNLLFGPLLIQAPVGQPRAQQAGLNKIHKYLGREK